MTTLALGTFTSGVHTNWRLTVIGAALGLGTVAVAYMEQYLWILFALALLALGLIIFGARWRRRDGYASMDRLRIRPTRCRSSLHVKSMA